MPAEIEFLIGFGVGCGIWLLNAMIRANAPQRHARYRMRVRLARWLMEGKLTPARAKKGKIVAPRSVLRLSRARRGTAHRDTAERREGVPDLRIAPKTGTDTE